MEPQAALFRLWWNLAAVRMTGFEPVLPTTYKDSDLNFVVKAVKQPSGSRKKYGLRSREAQSVSFPFYYSEAGLL